jgi:hypothetical protein
VETPDALTELWLALDLEQEELLLAWLGGTTTVFLTSRIEASAEAPVSLMVTSRRVARVALSELGDVRVEPVSVEDLLRSPNEERASVQTLNWEYRARRQNDGLVRDVLDAQRKDEPTRLLWFARATWIDGPRTGKSAERALELTERAVAAGGLLARAARFAIQTELGTGAAEPPTPEDLDALRRAATPTDGLVRLVESWDFSPATAQALVRELRRHRGLAEPWALALHQHTHDRLGAGSANRTTAAKEDIDLAEHLLEVDESARARRLLEARLRAMPSEDMDSLLPPGDADLTRGAGGPALRIRVRELLARSRDTTDLDTLAELAQLQPLMLDRVDALVDAAHGTLRQRAQSVAALLKPAGLVGDSGTRESVRRDAPLSEDELERFVSHPLARNESPFTAKLQALLASAPVPDHSVLRDYCEKLERTEHSVAEGALDDAARVLGVDGVSAYVSRGNKSVGVRAYEGSPPFVLIGGQHLEPGPYRMSAAELRFALGAELAHLRLGHTPVTSSEVWAGALKKTGEGVDLALTFLPALKSYKLASRMSSALSKLPAPAIREMVTKLSDLRARFSSDTDNPQNLGALSRINEELITAHRVMQLTADRAGLLSSADLQASLRAMLLLRSDHRDLLERSLREGLISVLSERDASGKMAHQALAVRIAALLSFYLSSEYARLSANKPA